MTTTDPTVDLQLLRMQVNRRIAEAVAQARTLDRAGQLRIVRELCIEARARENHPDARVRGCAQRLRAAAREIKAMR
jgi:hypothetical protein